MINLDENKGKGNAVIEGLKKSSGDYIIIQDADLEYDPKDYSALIKPFKDTDADALAFTSNFIKDVTSMGNMQVFYSETSGNTTARTYKIRCGNIQNAGTFTFNGQAGSRKFGGTVLSTIRIIEIEA